MLMPSLNEKGSRISLVKVEIRPDDDPVLAEVSEHAASWALSFAFSRRSGVCGHRVPLCTGRSDRQCNVRGLAQCSELDLRGLPRPRDRPLCIISSSAAIPTARIRAGSISAAAIILGAVIADPSRPVRSTLIAACSMQRQCLEAGRLSDG